MTGYQETLTDPSYHRQVVVMTAPHIGNTGVNDEDAESRRIWVSGYVVRDPARRSSQLAGDRAASTTSSPAQGVVGISGVDTRALTRHLRERGAMRVGVSSSGDRPARRCSSGCSRPGDGGADLAGEVTTRAAVRRAGDGARTGSPSPRSTSASSAMTPQRMAERGIEVHVLPASSTARRPAGDRRRRRVLLQRPGRPGHRRPRRRR